LDAENGVSLSLVKELLMYLYAAALLVASLLPGIPTRLAVNVALIITFLYTKYLKPMTWVKNIVCASVISMAPWTAGSSVLHLLHHHHHNDATTMQIFLVPSLWRLSAVLFCGIFGREILMDCNDVEADRAAGIRTVPVVYGRQYASKIATVCAMVMWFIASTPPILALKTPTSAATTIAVPLRRLIFASIGGWIQVKGSWNVWKTQGVDPVVVNNAVNEGLRAAVFVLASFI
jgi:4-hydroxybenzoate polyprenyltransferase